MIKNYKVFIYLYILLFSKIIFASSSSSFLISQIAFNSYDFNKVLNQFSLNQEEYYKNDYLDELISAVVSDNLIMAEKIAIKILIKDENNQEAKLVSIVSALIENNTNKINAFLYDNNNRNNDLFEFLFFNDEKIKTKSMISNAFIEIVKSSYSSNENKYSQNYNFLLFYTSLSILLNEKNFEAIFIKGQILQIIEDFLFAERVYSKIPPTSNFYLDAQRNIAYNYSNKNGFENVESKIISIVEKNYNDHELLKILADFYRINKQYGIAIDKYSSLIDKNLDDMWYMYYLRGICYEQSGNWKDAEKDFLKSLSLKRDSPNVLNYLAYGWIERDIRIDESYVMLTDAYNANPDSFYILDSLAWAYFKKNNYTKAAELMEKVIDMAPGEAISLDHLGDIYFAMNRKREAIYFWKQAKDLADPEDNITDKISNKLSLYDEG